MWGGNGLFPRSPDAGGYKPSATTGVIQNAPNAYDLDSYAYSTGAIRLPLTNTVDDYVVYAGFPILAKASFTTATVSVCLDVLLTHVTTGWADNNYGIAPGSMSIDYQIDGATWVAVTTNPNPYLEPLNLVQAITTFSFASSGCTTGLQNLKVRFHTYQTAAGPFGAGALLYTPTTSYVVYDIRAVTQ